MAGKKLDVIGRLGAPNASSDNPEEKLTPEQIAGVQEALDSVSRDGSIPAEEIEAWIESWDTDNELPPPKPRHG